jgi:hypothetical protein
VMVRSDNVRHGVRQLRQYPPLHRDRIRCVGSYATTMPVNVSRSILGLGVDLAQRCARNVTAPRINAFSSPATNSVL